MANRVTWQRARTRTLETIPPLYDYEKIRIFFFQRISLRDTAKPKRALHAGFCRVRDRSRVLPRSPVNFPLDHASTWSVTTLLLGTAFSLARKNDRSLVDLYVVSSSTLSNFKIFDLTTFLRWNLGEISFNLIYLRTREFLSQSLIEQSELFIIFNIFCISLVKLDGLDLIIIFFKIHVYILLSNMLHVIYLKVLIF